MLWFSMDTDFRTSRNPPAAWLVLSTCTRAESHRLSSSAPFYGLSPWFRAYTVTLRVLDERVRGIAHHRNIHSFLPHVFAPAPLIWYRLAVFDLLPHGHNLISFPPDE